MLQLNTRQLVHLQDAIELLSREGRNLTAVESVILARAHGVLVSLERQAVSSLRILKNSMLSNANDLTGGGMHTSSHHASEVLLTMDDLADCIRSAEDVKLELEDIERRLAKELDVLVRGVRQVLLARSKKGTLPDSELVSEWQCAYARFLSWLEEQQREKPKDSPHVGPESKQEAATNDQCPPTEPTGGRV